jgi:ribosomal protein S11
MNIVVKVNSTYNNTIVSALYKGKILKTISTGSLGFKKAKRASTLAAQTCGEALGSWLLLLNKSIARNKNLADSGLNTNSNFEYTLLQEAKKKLVVGGSKKGNVNETESKVKKLDSALIQDSSLEKNKSLINKNKEDSLTLKNTSIDKISLLISGVGYGKFGVIRGLSKVGIKIKTISDITAIPHNGCKPPKMRRK